MDISFTCLSRKVYYNRATHGIDINRDGKGNVFLNIQALDRENKTLERLREVISSDNTKICQ